MLRHNKKRNVGLLYEFLVRHVAECLTRGNERDGRSAMRLLRRFILRRDTELYREFRLFHALVNTTVKSEIAARQILAEARAAARAYNETKLDHEKSLLIKGINHTFNDASFYDKRFDEYRIYATVQTLLNEWRKDRPDDVSQLVQFEEQAVDWLMAEKSNNVLEESQGDVDDVVVNLMIKKVNSKYDNVLSQDQIGLIKQYVYSVKNGDDAALRESLEKLRKDTLLAVNTFIKDESATPYAVQRLNEVRDLLEGKLDTIDDDVIAQFLRVARLKQEITEV